MQTWKPEVAVWVPLSKSVCWYVLFVGIVWITRLQVSVNTKKRILDISYLYQLMPNGLYKDLFDMYCKITFRNLVPIPLFAFNSLSNSMMVLRSSFTVFESSQESFIAFLNNDLNLYHSRSIAAL